MINTNLVIGRLGSGKTTCIKHLIENIPENEYWLIIVNEFGQIGIDAALLSGQQNNSLNITEINGGCICCAAQSKLRVTLTNLIRKKEPDRIIIEATGLGHPAGIIDLLRQEYLSPIIKLNSIITLIDISLFEHAYDPQNTKSPLSTDSFNQQAQLADIIIFNKMDLATKNCLINANDYLKTIYPEKFQVIQTQDAKLDMKYLSLISEIDNRASFKTSTENLSSFHNSIITHKDITVENFSSQSDEYYSIGYIFPATVVFNRKKLQLLFEQSFNNNDSSLVRLKAVFNCGRFWQGFNAVNSTIGIAESYYRRDSRIELLYINQDFDIDAFKDALFLCSKELC